MTQIVTQKMFTTKLILDSHITNEKKNIFAIDYGLKKKKG